FNLSKAFSKLPEKEYLKWRREASGIAYPRGLNELELVTDEVSEELVRLQGARLDLVAAVLRERGTDDAEELVARLGRKAGVKPKTGAPGGMMHAQDDASEDAVSEVDHDEVDDDVEMLEADDEAVLLDEDEEMGDAEEEDDEDEEMEVFDDDEEM